MPRGRERAIGVVSPPWRPLRGFSGFRRWRGIGLVTLLCVGCSGRTDGTTSETPRPVGAQGAGSPSPFAGIGHVGNQVRGIDAIPDYDEQARTLRARVEPQLPDPLPSPRAACVTMLDAARKFYVDTEGESSVSVTAFEATRDADLEACTEKTGPAAAACVAVLMAQSEGEYPWVLDQCSRAFPVKTPG